MQEPRHLQDVPRETLERLRIHTDLLRKWNQRINLVAPATLDDAWTRHIADSLQVAEQADGGQVWLDLGSGGGFPGLVIAAVHADVPAHKTILVESDQRKSAFLRTVIREAGLMAEVITDRIENVSPLSADVLTARALAPLNQLLEYSSIHRKPDGRSLFPKGKSWREEVDAARKTWDFEWSAEPSRTHPESVILNIGDHARV